MEETSQPEVFVIKSRYGSVLYQGPQINIKEALQEAVRQRKDLEGADLRGAYLEGADLRGAYLEGAYLRGADLRGAYLEGADLRGAYLEGADLRGAYLEGVKVSWNSHALIAEILRRAAEDDVEKRMIAGLIAVSTDWCWDQFLKIDHPQREWAIKELAKWVTDDDRAPEIIRDAKEVF